MPPTGYRLFLGTTLDIIFSDEKRAELALIDLVSQLENSKPQYQSMVAIDQLSAYIALGFQHHSETNAQGRLVYQSLDLPNVGVFAFEHQHNRWCCYNKRFGSIVVQVELPMNVMKIKLL